MTLLKKMLFQYQGHISAALVLGGVDITGPHLYTVYPHGRYDHSTRLLVSSREVNYVIMLVVPTSSPS